MIDERGFPTHIQIIYRIIDQKQFLKHQLPEPAFGNVEYRVQFTMSTKKDRRIMSFVDTLWGFEVTGGYDQYEPLTVIAVRRSGYARRAGIHENDRIVQINDTPADPLTLREAQILIRESGKQLRIYVKGDVDYDDDNEYTVDFWFKPPRKKITVENQWGDCFPWNDRRKKIYRESNCFLVPSKAEEKIIERMLSGKAPVVIIPSKENVVESAEEIETRERIAEAEKEMINSSKEIARRQRLAESERDLASSLRAHTPTADEANITITTETTTTVTTSGTNETLEEVDKGR